MSGASEKKISKNFENRGSKNQLPVLDMTKKQSFQTSNDTNPTNYGNQLDSGAFVSKKITLFFQIFLTFQIEPLRANFMEEFNALKTQWEAIKSESSNRNNGSVRNTSYKNSSKNSRNEPSVRSSVNFLSRRTSKPATSQINDMFSNDEIANLQPMDDSSSTPQPLGDPPTLNKFLSNEENSRRAIQNLNSSSSTGQISSSIGRMSFGRSKKQKARNSQGMFNNTSKVTAGKKDYTAGLMAIEEKLRPKDKPKQGSARGGRNTLKNARHAKRQSKANSTLSDLKSARQAAKNKTNAASKKSTGMNSRATGKTTRTTRNERLDPNKKNVSSRTKRSTLHPKKKSNNSSSKNLETPKSEKNLPISSTVPQTPRSQRSKRSSISSTNTQSTQKTEKSSKKQTPKTKKSVVKPKPTPKKRTRKATATGANSEKDSEKELTKGQQMFKEIEVMFKDALKKVEELEKAAGGNPCSKMSFKKELTKMLTACRGKARRVV